MNRMEEYQALLAELEPVPETAAGTIRRAVSRRRRKRFLFQPLSIAAALFVCFAALVNLVPGVAHACSNIPILDKLAAAVSFSPSLTQAVEHGQVQTIDQSQTGNGVTATIESIIVDQKQVVVYYTLQSDIYDHLIALAVDAVLMDGTDARATITAGGGYDENGALHSATINFLEGAFVPDRLRVRLYISSMDEKGFLVEGDLFNPEFTLDIEPQLTEQGRTVMLNQPLNLGGQRFTLTQVETYPTHIRVNLKADPDNTATLYHLEFYLELSDGTRLKPGSSGGISATGGEESVSLYAESSYFYNADHMTLVITGAAFLDKNTEPVWVDLTTGEHDPIPFDGRIDSIEQTEIGWELQIVAKECQGIHGGVFSWEYTAPDGTKDTSGHMGYSTGVFEGGTLKEVVPNYYDIPIYERVGGTYRRDYGTQFLYVDEYRYDEVYLTLIRTDEWIPETPVSVEIY